MMNMMTIMANCFCEMNDCESVTSPISNRDHCHRFLKIANYGHNTKWKRSKIFNSVKHIKLKQSANTSLVLLFMTKNQL